MAFRISQFKTPIVAQGLYPTGEDVNSCVLTATGLANVNLGRHTGQVLDYFQAYCNHYNIQTTTPEISYDKHFHHPSTGFSSVQMTGQQFLVVTAIQARNTLLQQSLEAGPYTYFRRAAAHIALIERTLHQEFCLVSISASVGTYSHTSIVGYDDTTSQFYWYNTLQTLEPRIALGPQPLSSGLNSLLQVYGQIAPPLTPTFDDAVLFL